MPFWRLAQHRSGSQSRRPGRLLLNHHQSAQGSQISLHRVAVQRPSLATDVGRQRPGAYCSRHVTCKRLEQAADVGGVAGYAIRSRNVDTADLLQVVDARSQAGVHGHVQVAWPTASADVGSEISHLHVQRPATFEASPQQIRERYLRGGEPHFPGRHGAQPQAGHAARPGVACDVVRWYGRPRQNELSAIATLIDRTPYVVPDARLDLPLVDETRYVSGEYQRRIYGHCPPCVLVYIEQHLAGGQLAGGFSFAASSWSLNQHGTRSGKPVSEFPVCNPRYVCGHASSLTRHL